MPSKANPTKPTPTPEEALAHMKKEWAAADARAQRYRDKQQATNRASHLKGIL